MNLNQNSFKYSLFHIRMTKTNYDQVDNFRRIEKKVEEFGQPDNCFCS